ncbi:MAG: AAA family ATPase [Pirellulales bacterium]|nr:AAA family ATPase [Pirellulales bacterium]
MNTSPSQPNPKKDDQYILNPPDNHPRPPLEIHDTREPDHPPFGAPDPRCNTDEPRWLRQTAPDNFCLANLPTQEVNWLWPGRIPIGKVTLLVGDPGVGKSLIALDVAARLTAGAPWPDAAECGRSNAECGSNEADSRPATPAPHSPFRRPHSVLLLSAEDDLADTIRPRLEAAGADCSRIIALPANWSPDDPAGLHRETMKLRDGRPLSERPAPPRPFDLRQDIPLLDAIIQRRPDCRLVIIDPLSAFLGPGVETLNAEVRRVMAALADLAARRRLAVVAINHLRKAQGAALHRSMGSLAFVAAARSTWLVAKDPADAGRRLLLPVKNNLAALGGPLACTIQTAGPERQPIIEWSPDAPAITADEALNPSKRPTHPKPPTGRPNIEREDAARWLQNALAEGAKPSAQIERHAMAHGLRRTTVRRAFRELGGEAVKSGFGPLSEWYWRLPGVGEQEPKPTLEHLWLD